MVMQGNLCSWGDPSSAAGMCMKGPGLSPLPSSVFGLMQGRSALLTSENLGFKQYLGVKNYAVGKYRGCAGFLPLATSRIKAKELLPAKNRENNPVISY